MLHDATTTTSAVDARSHEPTTSGRRTRKPAREPGRPSPSELRRDLAGLRPELYARAMRLARSPSRAEDLVQDTMVRALRFERQYRPGTNLRAWVGQILRTVFLSHCRRSKREIRALDRLQSDPCAWVHREAPSVMRSLSPRPAFALGSLSESYQQVLRLVDLDGLTYREAAERLEVPVGTVMSRLHRGRKMLASLLAEAPAPATPAAALAA
ncbi:MAG: sigma-70 family RNA polymerase sigma factor [Deltaproteobacteria bacterium]|jgi:RNA polymerase sigma-70 factor (ECF subfamily)|nr:sigma-70 family RNA polymerase sigma factor [Deltaproteobacteria bacterium]MBW2531013.1 sigma-70 family RNA polymerase sigma factor [Deltaproteobacteria bacterium]